MLIDKFNTFSWAQAITADAISANVIDLLPVSGAVGAGATGGPSANIPVIWGLASRSTSTSWSTRR